MLHSNIESFAKYLFNNLTALTINQEQLMTTTGEKHRDPSASRRHARTRRRYCAVVNIQLLAALLILTFVINANAAAESKVDEYDLKAVYLYNFSKFISWPDESFTHTESTFNICIQGRMPSKSIISQLAKRKTQGRTLRIWQVDKIASTESCHILYFRNGHPNEIVPALSDLHQKPILKVGDFSGFAESGGVVEFFVSDNDKLKLIINLDQATADGIEISAQLLEIASVVHREEKAQ